MATTYCDRCGGTFLDHMLYGWKICIGVSRPPVLYGITVIELKPMDTPVSKIFESDPKEM